MNYIPNDLLKRFLNEIHEGKFDNFREHVKKNNITTLILEGKNTEGISPEFIEGFLSSATLEPTHKVQLVAEALRGTQITQIGIFNHKIAEEEVKGFAIALKDTNITIVNLSQNKLGNKGAKEFAENLKNANVTCVTLNANEIDHEGAKNIGNALKGTNVTYVGLDTNQIGDQGAKDFFDALTGTNVTHVNLSNNNIGAQGAKDFGGGLKNTNVTHVNLSNNNIGDQGAKDFGESLKNTNVTHVNLDSNQIGDQGAKDFFDALTGTKVIDVTLARNNIGTQRVNFGENLKNTNITHVNLNNNCISAQGAKDFFDALTGTKVIDVKLARNNIATQGQGENFGENLKNTNVSVVDLSCNLIGDTSVQNFGNSLKNSNVSVVNLTVNRITRQGAQNFATCIPDTKLLQVFVDDQFKPYISDALQLNIAKHLYTPYYCTALKLLPKQEKSKFKNIKKEALNTHEGQLQYAGGILMDPLLHTDILDIILSFIHPENEGKASKYLTCAKQFHPNGLTIRENPFNAPYQPEIENQYRLYQRKNATTLESPVNSAAPNQTHRKNSLL